jgi:hypothetical protein
MSRQGDDAARIRRRFEVTDDSGFLALVDHHAYQSFVDADWAYDSLFAHFRTAMAERQLLLWGSRVGAAADPC